MLILVLRLLHIGSGVFWVGAFLTFFQFVQPAATAVAPTATGFTYRLLHHRRFSFWMLGAAITTVIAGLWLLGITSDGYNLSVMLYKSHLGFTIGGLAAIITLGVGGLYAFPRTRVVERTIGGFLSAQRPPNPEEQQLLARVARETRAASWIVLVGLTVAVLCMATARYWPLVF